MARVLVVDDSIVMRKNLITILTGDGHEVVGEASNGRQAVVQYEELKPDLVTMDISMPIMSGVEAVKKIISKYPDAKIIMISAVNQKKMVFNAINSGAKHYIIKPIVGKKVISVVKEVINMAIEEQMKETVEESNGKQGFEINNVEGTFIITFNSFLDKSDHNLLNMAIRGILFIKPLKVEFNFNELEDISTEVLQPILTLANEVEYHEGIVTFNYKTDKIKDKLPLA